MEIPEGWTQKKINDVLSKKTESVDVQAGDEYRQIGIRSHGKGIFYKEPVSGLSLGNKRIFWIHADCFIVNIVFGWEQAVAVTSGEEVGMVASHRFPMYCPKNNGCDVKYIEYFFKTKYGKYLLELASPGGAGRNKTLGQKSFLEIPLVLPALKEQQKIVKVLKTWDQAIAVCEALIVASEAQKKALMQQLLTGKRRLPGFEGEWKEVRFRDLVNIEIGGTPSRKNPLYWDDNKVTENRWVSIRDLKGKYIFETKEHLSDEGIQNSNVKLIARGTVIMSFKLTIGKAAILEAPCYTNEAITALTPKDKTRLDRDYFFQALAVVNFDAEIDQAIKGKTLNKAKLAKLKLMVPSMLEQQAIASTLTDADRVVASERAQLQTLKTEKSALMQQLLTGKRRVKLTEAVA